MEKQENVVVHFKYKEKEIVIKEIEGKIEYFKKKDENGAEIKGKLAKKHLDSSIKYLLSLLSDNSKLLSQINFEDKYFLKIDYKQKSKYQPLALPRSCKKDIREEAVELFKACYAELLWLADEISTK